MSDHFDELLSAVADSAGSVASKPGAAAARKRGGQRRTRQRTVGAALTLALLGSMGGIAAVSVNHSGQSPAASSTGIATSSASGAASAGPSTSVSASPAQSASTAGSPGAGASASTSGSPAGSTNAASTGANTGAGATGADAATWSALPGRWLSPSQVPLDGTLNWTGGSASTAQSGTSLMGVTPVVYPCDDKGLSLIMATAHGYAVNYFSATAHTSAAEFDGTPHAQESYFLFASTSAAQAAYQGIQHDVGGCSTLTDMTSANTHRPMTAVATTTATAPTGFAYTYILRDDQGSPAQVNGNYGGDSDYHGYVIRNHNLIEIVWLSGGPVVDGASGDSSALSQLAADLG